MEHIRTPYTMQHIRTPYSTFMNGIELFKPLYLTFLAYGYNLLLRMCLSSLEKS
jgi:hypothetical protein